jgi:hypothetical protein
VHGDPCELFTGPLALAGVQAGSNLEVEWA